MIYRCSHTDLQYTLGVIGGKWKALIVCHLTSKSMRYHELERVTGMAHRVLTYELRELEKKGIICRSQHQTNGRRVEYSLTPLGKTLEPLLKALMDWSYDRRYSVRLHRIEDRF